MLPEEAYGLWPLGLASRLVQAFRLPNYLEVEKAEAQGRRKFLEIDIRAFILLTRRNILVAIMSRLRLLER